jgi:CDP-glycerol glycerophosphotransferase (TagB/SpsB family)
MILALGVLFSFQKWDTSETDDKWLKALNELSLKKPEWRIVLRPHPTEPLALYEEKLAGLGETAIVLDRTTPIHQALQSSRAMIVSFPSTVVLEASLLQVPVVFLDLELAIQQNDYTSEPGALTSCAAEDLVRVLEAVTNGPEQRNSRCQDREDFLNRFLGFRDGRNAERVAQLIDKLYRNQPAVTGSN